MLGEFQAATLLANLVYPAIRHLTAFECRLGCFIISHLLSWREKPVRSPLYQAKCKKVIGGHAS